MAFTSDDSVHRYVRELMAIPFLPFHEISPMFICLGAQAQTQLLCDLVHDILYVCEFLFSIMNALSVFTVQVNALQTSCQLAFVLF